MPSRSMAEKPTTFYQALAVQDCVHPFSQAVYEPGDAVVTAAPDAERALFQIGCGDYARARFSHTFTE